MSKFKFKNSGKKVNDFVDSEEYLEKIQGKKIKPFGIILPIQSKKKSTESLFAMTYSPEDQLLVDLKTLILTRKGEYLTKPNFGTNIIDLYSRTNIDDVNDIVTQEVQEAVTEYLPSINLINFTSTKFRNNDLDREFHKVIIEFNIPLLSDKSHELILNIASSR